MNTCHPVCSASLVNSNYGWMYRKVNNSKREERGVKKQLLYMVWAVTQQSTQNMYHQTIGIGYVQSHLCVAQSKGHRGQDFQMFPIIPQLWRDFPGHPTLRLSLLRIKKEGQKLTNLFATLIGHCCLYWTEFTKPSGQCGWKDSSFQNDKPPFLWFLRKIPPLTVFLSWIAYILVDHDGGNPVAWIKTTKQCPGEILP